MKRLTLATLTALVALGGWNVPAVLAHGEEDHEEQTNWRGGDDDRDVRDDDRDWRGGDRDDDRDHDGRWWDGRRDDHDGRYGRHERVNRYLLNDRLFLALQSTGRIRVNNFYENGRYRTSGQVFRPSIVRLERRLGDGTYEVWFNGNSYPAYTRTYRGKTLLYVGQAPTRQGYRFELILE